MLKCCDFFFFHIFLWPKVFVTEVPSILQAPKNNTYHSWASKFWRGKIIEFSTNNILWIITMLCGRYEMGLYVLFGQQRSWSWMSFYLKYSTCESKSVGLLLGAQATILTVYTDGWNKKKHFLSSGTSWMNYKCTE